MNYKLALAEQFLIYFQKKKVL